MSIRSLGNIIRQQASQALSDAKDSVSSLKAEVNAALPAMSSKQGKAPPRQSLGNLPNAAETPQTFGQYLLHGDEESKAAMAALKKDLTPDFSGIKDKARQLRQEVTEAGAALKKELKNTAWRANEERKQAASYLRRGDAESQAAMAALKKDLTPDFSGIKDKAAKLQKKAAHLKQEAAEFKQGMKDFGTYLVTNRDPRDDRKT